MKINLPENGQFYGWFEFIELFDAIQSLCELNAISASVRWLIHKISSKLYK